MASSRFLGQATFGPVAADKELLKTLREGGWIDRQFTVPAASHRAYWDAADAALKAVDPLATAGQEQVLESFWKQALTGPDQLRQRVAYALSQIFVVSMVDSAVGDQPRAVASWLDMLGDKGFGTYRDLLEGVARHPVMGVYLSHLRNQKANAATGRVPDENFAREVLQLFSIGLIQLNPDGTPKLVNGQPVDTYTPADISGLAKVFTGFSWDCPAFPQNSCFSNGSYNGQTDLDRWVKPMRGYPQYHSPEAKQFLGITIGAQSPAAPDASLKTALDALAAHPNVGPFIGRQLIQRLVTSNPSPRYVAAVSAVFADNGAGVRGDMKAVIKAVLLNEEARKITTRGTKLREPVLRLSTFLRAYPHTSDTGRWRVGTTDNPGTALGQTPLRAGSVFNFYRPGYVPPNSATAALGLVSPELQLVHETSVAGWVNYMRDNLRSGVGAFNGTVGGTVFNRRDLQHDYTPEMNLAGDPKTLVERIASQLGTGLLPEALRRKVSDAVATIAIPAPNGNNATQIADAKRNRVHSALLLVLASPEFQVEK